MGLGVTRRIICVIAAALVALSTAVLMFSSLVGSTLASQTFVEKYMVKRAPESGSMTAAQAEQQLDLKYKTLAAETGLPFRVFETVKTDFPTKATIKSAFQNVFGAEDSTYYNDNMVDYFYNLCTEYLDGVEASYNEDDIRRAADKAAVIYSETIGIHNVSDVSLTLGEIRDNAVTASIVSAAVVFSILIVMLVYVDRKKGFVYILSGASGGAFGAAVSAFIMSFMNFGTRLNVLPLGYQGSLNTIARNYFIIVAIVSVIFCAALYMALLIVANKAKRKTRGIIFG